MNKRDIKDTYVYSAYIQQIRKKREDVQKG